MIAISNTTDAINIVHINVSIVTNKRSNYLRVFVVSKTALVGIISVSLPEVSIMIDVIKQGLKNKTVIAAPILMRIILKKIIR